MMEMVICIVVLVVVGKFLMLDCFLLVWIGLVMVVGLLLGWWIFGLYIVLEGV